MIDQQPRYLITVAAARDLLGISNAKIARLIKAGTLRCFANALDMRTKLVSRIEALSLKPQFFMESDSAATIFTSASARHALDLTKG